MSKTKPKTETKNTTQTEQTITELFADVNVSMKTGHLTKDAELVSEGKYVKLRIATNKQYKTKDGEIKTNTNYFNALVSGNLKKAFPLAQEFKKGDWIYLKGEDQTQGFDTPQGYRKSETTIFAYEVALKKAKEQPNQSQQPEAVPA